MQVSAERSAERIAQQRKIVQLARSVTEAASRRLRIMNLINGQWLEGTAATVEKYGPRDGDLLCRFPAAGVHQVDTAVAGAREAFNDGRWSRRPVSDRKAVLGRLASLIEEHAAELAVLESLDVGKPIRESVGFDVPAAAAIIRFNAEAADKLFGKVYGVDESSLTYQLRRPVGVVGGIVGWNFPMVLAATKIGPALASGNSLVLKSSELTPFSTVRIAELAVQAGVPEGVLNVVHGAAQVGEALARHGDVDLVTFTGSTQTGKKLLIIAGESNMKRLLLECGGKAPNIVFEDCPALDAVADGIVARAFWNQGQVCTASSRLLVQESVKDALIRLLVKKTATLQFGDPLHLDTHFGALVTRGQQKKVLAYVDEAEMEGASVIYRSDSKPPYAGGFYVPPILLDKVLPRQKIAREEIFGPVLCVMSFRDESEAIHLANETMYGLSAILWTKDIGRAHRMTQSVSAGWIVVNATGRPSGGPSEGALPVEGHKESGIGIEGGIEGIEAYTSHTAVQFFV